MLKGTAILEDNSSFKWWGLDACKTSRPHHTYARNDITIWSSSVDQERTAKRYVGTMFIELNNVPTIIGLRLNNNKGLPPFAY